MQNKPTIAVIGGRVIWDRAWRCCGRQPAIPSSLGRGRRSGRKPRPRSWRVRPDGAVRGDDNRGAAQAADIVVLCVPYSNHDATLEDIKPAMDGKILVDAVVPLVPPKVSVVQLPAAGSPAAVAQRVLGPQVRVAAAFHNVGAKKLHGGEKVDCDVLVFADDADVRERIIALAGIVATRGVDGGSLANAVAAEALTSVLIAINRRYKVPGAGIRITGLPAPETR